MATLTVKQIPEKLHRRLKARASANRRSLNSEVIACLEAAVTPQRIDVDSLLSRAASLRRRVAGELSDSDLAALRSQGRP